MGWGGVGGRGVDGLLHVWHCLYHTWSTIATLGNRSNKIPFTYLLPTLSCLFAQIEEISVKRNLS